MASELTPIDVTDTTDLLRIAEEVRRSGQPRLLRREDEDLAVLMPAEQPKRRGSRTQPVTNDDPLMQLASSDRSGIQRALSAIGAWEHVDAEDGPDMLDELDRLRHETKPTPPFDL
jgi:hypothetical protein